jgi:hypothetical protein
MRSLSSTHWEQNLAAGSQQHALRQLPIGAATAWPVETMRGPDTVNGTQSNMCYCMHEPGETHDVQRVWVLHLAVCTP